MRTVVFSVACTSPALTRLHQCPVAAVFAPALPVGPVEPVESVAAVEAAEVVLGGEAVELDEQAARHTVDVTRPIITQTPRNGVVLDMICQCLALPFHEMVKTGLRVGERCVTTNGSGPGSLPGERPVNLW